MQLEVSYYQLPESIDFNFEELKQELTEKVQTYKTIVYDDNQIKEAKADKANLNKLKKALNDERIKREKEYMMPFNEFKSKIAEIISIIDEPIAIIDSQVKEYENKKKQEKHEAICELWDGMEDRPEWLSLQMIFDDTWLNATASMKSIKDAIEAKISRIRCDIVVLEELPEFSFEAVEEYKRTLDLATAVNEGKRLADMQRRKLETEKAREAFLAEQEAKHKEKIEAQKTDPVIVDEIRQWISFSAYLTIDEAMLLKTFFEENNIQFRRA